MQKDVKLFLVAKRDRLVRIALTKRRHRTEEEKKRYDDRYSKAITYLGELNVIFNILEETNFQAKTTNNGTLELLRKYMWIEPLFVGEYVELYYCEKTKEHMLVTKSVTDIESFK